jgi:hypothetical protein
VGSGSGSGSGNSGIIIDILGEANLNFHGIPLNAIKKASFITKLNTACALLKMTVNNVTYDFEKTAQNGAVIFGLNYGLWDFVAPDGRFDFPHYVSQEDALSVNDVLMDMERILTTAPVPAWDTFIRWLGDNLREYGIDTSGITSCFVSDLNGLFAPVRSNVISLHNLTDCVSFIQDLEKTLEPIASQPASTFAVDGDKIGFAFRCCIYNKETNTEEEAFALAFRFRQ